MHCRRRERRADRARAARRHAPRRRRPPSRHRRACGRCSTTWPGASRRTASRSRWSSRSRHRGTAASCDSLESAHGSRRGSSTTTHSSRSLDAAADLLVVEDDVSRVSVLGFCMGGYYTFKAAASGRFDAAVAFYGMLRTPEGWRGPGHALDPLDIADAMCPTLAIFGIDRPVHAGRRHRRAARGVEGSRRLRDRRRRRRRARFRPRPRTTRAPRRRRRRSCWATRDRLGPAECRRRYAARAGQLVAVEDAVAAAAGDLEPAEPHEQSRSPCSRARVTRRPCRRVLPA